MLAATLGHQCQLTLRFGPNIRGQSNGQGLRAGSLRSAGIPVSLQETRKAKEVEAFFFFETVCRFREHRIDFAKKSRKAAQVQLIVPQNSHDGLRRSASQIVEVILRD